MQSQIHTTLILHDTQQPKINQELNTWINDFRISIESAWSKTYSDKRSFILSWEAIQTSNNLPDWSKEEYDSIIVLLSQPINELADLQLQLNQVLLNEKHEDIIQEIKVILVLLGKYNLDKVPYDHIVFKQLRFYKHIHIGDYSKFNFLSLEDKEYWFSLIDINEWIYQGHEPLCQKDKTDVNRYTVYLSDAPEDLDSQRKKLSDYLVKRGIRVISMHEMKSKKEFDRELFINEIEKAQIIIQFIGGRYESHKQNSGPPDYFSEHNLITKIIAGEIKRTLHRTKDYTRLFWIPDAILITDSQQKAYIADLKRQIKHLPGKNDILTGNFESLKDFILQQLYSYSQKKRPSLDKSTNYIYLIHERSEYEEVQVYLRNMEDFKLNILLTDELNSRADFFKAHTEAIIESSAIIIHLGSSKIDWFESTKADIERISRIKRNQPHNFIVVIADKEIITQLSKHKGVIYLSKNDFEGNIDLYTKLQKMQ